MAGIRRKVKTALPSFFQSTGIKPFADDAAYATAKGSAAVVGDAYFNTTSEDIRVHNGTVFLESITADASGNVIIAGDFTVNGTTTTINTATLDVEDLNITINKNGNQTSADDAAGLTVEMSDADNALIIYNKDVASRWEVGDVGSRAEVVTVSNTQTLTNKTLDNTNAITVLDASFTIQDNADPTKQAKFQLASISAATTRTFTLPDANTIVVGTDATQTLTNKTITAGSNTISGLTHGSEVDNPTTNVHGVAGTVVGTSDSQTLTNKGINSDNNTITNIVDADIKALAAIARSKIASGTNDHVIINSGTGPLSSEAQLAKSRGGTGADNTNVTFPSTGTLATLAGAEALTNKTIDGNSNTLTVLAASQLSGAVPIANGGTGQTAKTAAFDALAPTTTKGDIIVHDGSNNLRLAVGANDLVPIADSGEATGIRWGTPAVVSNSASTLFNAGIAAGVASSALTIDLTQADGSTDPTAGNPVTGSFRASTSAAGSFTQVSATAATTLVIPSGATLGHRSAVAEFLYVYILNNAGTIELAVSTKFFDEGKIVGTTAISTASDLNNIYSTTSRSNVAIRLVARLKSNQAVAGTWDTAISEIALTSQQIIKQPKEFIAITSSVKTPTTGTYMQMTGNSMVLGAGSWQLTAFCLFSSSGGSPLYTSARVGWSANNGDDTGGARTNLSIIDAGFTDASTGNLINQGSVSDLTLNAPIIRVTSTSPSTVFLVPFVNATTAANARVTVFGWAERIPE